MTKLACTMVAAALWLLAGWAGSAVSAQQAPDSTARRSGSGLQGEDRVRHMSRMLGLTAAQEGRLRPIMAEYERKVRDVESDTGLEHRTKAARRRTLRDSKDDRVRAILTPEQRSRFERSRIIRERMGIE